MTDWSQYARGQSGAGKWDQYARPGAAVAEPSALERYSKEVLAKQKGTVAPSSLLSPILTGVRDLFAPSPGEVLPYGADPSQTFGPEKQVRGTAGARGVFGGFDPGMPLEIEQGAQGPLEAQRADPFTPFGAVNRPTSVVSPTDRALVQNLAAQYGPGFAARELGSRGYDAEATARGIAVRGAQDAPYELFDPAGWQGPGEAFADVADIGGDVFKTGAEIGGAVGGYIAGGANPVTGTAGAAAGAGAGNLAANAQLAALAGLFLEEDVPLGQAAEQAVTEAGMVGLAEGVGGPIGMAAGKGLRGAARAAGIHGPRVKAARPRVPPVVAEEAFEGLEGELVRPEFTRGPRRGPVERPSELPPPEAVTDVRAEVPRVNRQAEQLERGEVVPYGSERRGWTGSEGGEAGIERWYDEAAAERAKLAELSRGKVREPEPSRRAEWMREYGEEPPIGERIEGAEVGPMSAEGRRSLLRYGEAEVTPEGAVSGMPVRGGMAVTKWSPGKGKPSPAVGELVEVPPSRIKVDPKTYQFKSKADPETGVTEPLEGPYDPLGSPPLLLHRRKNGDVYVAHGHHRLDLAQREGVKGINAHVLDEAKGFTAKDALRMGAEQNIRDGHGTLEDFARYFRNSEETLESAKKKGLLGRMNVKADRGFHIGRGATDSTWSAWLDGRLDDDVAAGIARAAPGDAGRQAAAVGTIIRSGKNWKGDEAAAFVTALGATRKSAKSAGPRQTDIEEILGGFDKRALEEAEALAEVVKRRQAEITARIRSAKGAAMRPEEAAELGVEVGDVETTKASLKALEAERRGLDPQRWQTDLDKINELRQEAGLEPLSREELAGPQGEDVFGIELEKSGAPDPSEELLDEITEAIQGPELTPEIVEKIGKPKTKLPQIKPPKEGGAPVGPSGLAEMEREIAAGRMERRGLAPKKRVVAPPREPVEPPKKTPPTGTAGEFEPEHWTEGHRRSRTGGRHMREEALKSPPPGAELEEIPTWAAMQEKLRGTAKSGKPFKITWPKHSGKTAKGKGGELRTAYGRIDPPEDHPFKLERGARDEKHAAHEMRVFWLTDEAGNYIPEGESYAVRSFNAGAGVEVETPDGRRLLFTNKAAKPEPELEDFLAGEKAGLEAPDYELRRGFEDLPALEEAPPPAVPPGKPPRQPPRAPPAPEPEPEPEYVGPRPRPAQETFDWEKLPERGEWGGVSRKRIPEPAQFEFPERDPFELDPHQLTRDVGELPEGQRAAPKEFDLPETEPLDPGRLHRDVYEELEPGFEELEPMPSRLPDYDPEARARREYDIDPSVRGRAEPSRRPEDYLYGEDELDIPDLYYGRGRSVAGRAVGGLGKGLEIVGKTLQLPSKAIDATIDAVLGKQDVPRWLRAGAKLGARVGGGGVGTAAHPVIGGTVIATQLGGLGLEELGKFLQRIATDPRAADRLRRAASISLRKFRGSEQAMRGALYLMMRSPEWAEYQEQD